ncbi:type 3 dihydrofolate reductase [Ghiorsea bivora]|uniref:type 3 dihydrofolate reductase n=1 Tax=Ghiorsea bivora TaxID=1485545 RepID=UPI00056EE3F2|nr:type 3 dihydrofolate reductase [Ghiorsea bivora]
MISLIWAMDNNRLIGANNQMPWSISDLPADMAWFRKHTLGKAVLMGRKTFESIGKPLPKRRNIILSRQKSLNIEGCEVIHSLDDAVKMFQDDELMVMGGAEVYKLAIPYAEQLYYTQIDHTFEGDAWFPKLDMQQWQQNFSEKHEPDEKNIYPYTFEIYQKCGSKT